MSTTTPTQSSMPKGFVKASIYTFIWVYILEFLRGLVLVFPMLKAAFPNIPNLAPMTTPIIISWTVWTILFCGLVIYMYWLHARVSGHTWYSVVVSATVSTAFSIVLFWIATVNVGTGTVQIAVLAITWAWIELIIACQIMRFVMQREG